MRRPFEGRHEALVSGVHRLGNLHKVIGVCRPKITDLFQENVGLVENAVKARHGAPPRLSSSRMAVNTITEMKNR